MLVLVATDLEDGWKEAHGLREDVSGLGLFGLIWDLILT